MPLTELGGVAIQHDADLVTARRRASEVATLLGYDAHDQARIATAVSEVTSTAIRDAGGGHMSVLLDRDSHPEALVLRIVDQGPGIEPLDAVLAGQHASPNGPGQGLLGAKGLMDAFFVDTTRGRGTTVLMRKNLPLNAPPITTARVGSIRATLADRPSRGLLAEFQRQNQELLHALHERQAGQGELVRLNRELEDTNRGVVALYAELEERADHLRAAAELKSRFHSQMTHEFRTPVIAIIGLCDLLIERSRKRGETADSEVMYIREAAEHLSALVDDLLDLARMDAGKWTLRHDSVIVEDLFAALRGMLKPLLPERGISLIFDPAADLPPLMTDAAKVSQILRNLISNALKFTERGEIRVAARAAHEGEAIEFTVSDTGDGIATSDHERIFEEFLQLEDRLERRARGSGLGLPLSRRLAELLGGTLTVRSQRGAGATFTLRLPVRATGQFPSK